MSERRAVLMLYVFAAASGALTLFVRFSSPAIGLIVIASFALIVVFLGLYLGKVRVYEDQPESGNVIRMLADFSYKRRVFEVVLDVILAALTYYAAYMLRFEGVIYDEQMAIFVGSLPLVVVVQMVSLLAGGVYRGLWRYTSIADLLVIGRSVLVGTAASVLVVFYAYRIPGPSRSVFILTGLLFFMAIAASRLSFRLLAQLIGTPQTDGREDARPVVIYGAGDGGELLIRELLNNAELQYKPVAFIDDDSGKVGKLIHGFKIFRTSELPDLIVKYGVNDVVVSSRKVPESKLHELTHLGLNLRRLRISIE
jgi:UDP-GlcNAc:undecaprenyl-phosphate GlcNAc-1-phosphate transferase